MTRAQLAQEAGIKRIRKVSEDTHVVDFPNGTCRPATEVERRLWAVLLKAAGAAE